MFYRMDCKVLTAVHLTYLNNIGYLYTQVSEFNTGGRVFFNGMGSFLSFIMPEVEGLSLHFTDGSQLPSLPEGLDLEKGKYILPHIYLSFISLRDQSRLFFVY